MLLHITVSLGTYIGMISFNNWLHQPSQQTTSCPGIRRSHILIERPIRNLLHQRRRSTPGLIVRRLADLGLHLGVVHDLVLDFADTRFEVIEAQIRDLALEVVPVHDGRV